VYPDGGALALQSPGQHEARGLADVVRVWLERQSEQGDLLARERPQVLLQLPDRAPLLELVDFDDGGQELEVVAAVAGQLLEGLDVLGEAGTAVADSGSQELLTDALVEPHAAGDLRYVRSDVLGHVGDLVDERDL